MCFSCDLRFLPSICPERVEVEEKSKDEDAPLESASEKPKNWKLDLASWQLAFDRCEIRLCECIFRYAVLAFRYLLSGVMLGQFTFKQAQEYKLIIMEIAISGKSENRGTLLGVVYDEKLRRVSLLISFFMLRLVCSRLSREHAADVAGKMGAKFSIDEFFTKRSEVVMRRAQQAYDDLMREAAAARAKGKAGGKGAKDCKGLKRPASDFVSSKPEAKRPTLSCSFCGKEGHTEDRCWKKARTSGNSNNAVVRYMFTMAVCY